MDEKEERQALLERMTGGIQSMEELVAVRKDVMKWLDKHPDDHEVIEIDGHLAMLALYFDPIQNSGRIKQDKI